MYTGLRSGAIPVYDGAPEILEHVPSNSIIRASDFDSAEALGRYLQRLLEPSGRAEFSRYFEWNLTAFRASEAVRQCPWQCKVCELVDARKQKWSARQSVRTGALHGRASAHRGTGSQDRLLART